MPAQITGIPEHVPAELVRDFDILNDPGILANPWEAIDWVREDAPVLWSPKYGGHWLVTGSAEVRAVAQDGETFSNYPAGFPPVETGAGRKLIPTELDGEDHRRWRRLLTPMFSPRAIRPLEDSVRERAANIISGFADAGRVEFVTALARPLPAWVFLDLFGAPSGQAEKFISWARDLMHSTSPETVGAAQQAIAGYLTQMIAEHKSEPRQDMIGTLLTSEVDGRPLIDEEIFDVAFVLFLGGLDTVTAQLSVMAHHLATHPEQQQALRDNHSLVDSVLDELLRLKPVPLTARTLTRDHLLNGIPMKKGETVVLGYTAATRSEAAFDDATEARFDREETWTTAFGLGPHRCVGIHLARQELRVVLELLITLAPPFRLARDATWRWETILLWAPDRLDLEFTRG